MAGASHWLAQAGAVEVPVAGPPVVLGLDVVVVGAMSATQKILIQNRCASQIYTL